ncbi:haloacid dehalogenase [Beauveria brongniartii RCEF 3172]|uniref:Haloacid dehalogenase n=1 Tax=Beauveria brongniartii RCEF 3172 TaxID=1081107 RepID=A0A167EY15_9HYPO|nr:haloacid dehalogenase [Beauveria brongniartii RCEF 3172]
MAGKRNLLLCLDAFGTLFSPKGSVAHQYAHVARQCGLDGFSDGELTTHLMAAIRQERTRNPNYGKATGLGATQWWTNVIHKTFTPLIRENQPFPPALVPALIHRFASDRGYDAQPDLVPALRALRRPKALHAFDKVVIGVLTNSDDRVPSILSSFGLNVSPLRYGADEHASPRPGDAYDVDFHCMSYDVGFEKPSAQIFGAADSMLDRIVTPREGGSAQGQDWYKIYVGDEHAKDVVGAANAGWHPILLDADSQASDVAKLEDCPDQSIADVFQLHPVVRVPSIRALALWLSGSGWASKKAP